MESQSLDHIDFASQYNIHPYRQQYDIPYQHQFYTRNHSPGPSTNTPTPHRHSPTDDIFARQHDYNHGTSHEPEVNQIQDESPMDEEPLYVNAKQYFRILKRRVARARLEEVHRLSRQRKVC